MLSHKHKDDIEDLLKIGPIYLPIEMKNHYDYSKFILRFGDMKPGPQKNMFESFCRILEQTYATKKIELEEENVNVYLSYYESKKILIISTDVDRFFFYDTYKDMVNMETRKKLTDCFYKQSINNFFYTYFDDDSLDHNVFDNTFNYDRSLKICKDNKLLKAYKKSRIEEILGNSMKDILEDENVQNEYENNSMINDNDLDPINEDNEDYVPPDENDDDDEHPDPQNDNMQIDDPETQGDVAMQIDEPTTQGDVAVQIDEPEPQEMQIDEPTIEVVQITEPNQGGNTPALDTPSEDAPPEMIRIGHTEAISETRSEPDEDFDINFLRRLENYRREDNKYEIIGKPDQQYKIPLKYFNQSALFKANMIFEDNNEFNKTIKKDLVILAEKYNIIHINPSLNNYYLCYYSENPINCQQELNPPQENDNNQGQENDNNQAQGNRRVDYKQYKRKLEVEEFFFNNYDERERKRLRKSGHTPRQISKLRNGISIFNFPFKRLNMNEQIIYRSSLCYVRLKNDEYNRKYKDKKKLLNKKKKLYMDMTRSEIAHYLSPDVLILLFKSWDEVLLDKMSINYNSIMDKYLGIKVIDEGDNDSDDDNEEEDKEIPFNGIVSIINLFIYTYNDLNLKNNFMSFILCFCSLLSGLNTDLDESIINVNLLALPGEGKTFVLKLFFMIFKEFVDMFTIKQTNKVSTTKINKGNYKVKLYPDAPIELIKCGDQLKSPNQQQARMNMLLETDQKIQSNEYLKVGENDREAIKVARHSSRPYMMASTKSMGESDGGARRFFQKILKKRFFDTSDLFFIKQLQDFDVNSKIRTERISKHLYFLVKTIFMYFNIHYTRTMDNKPMEFVTDFYTILMTKKIKEKYEERFKKKIKTDPMKRVRNTTRLLCLIRVIQELFCYKKSKFYKKEKIDYFILYREIQKKAYTTFQDLALAINILNDEFYDRTLNEFMQFIMKKYQLIKLDDGDDIIFDKPENLVKFYNNFNKNNVQFRRENDGGFSYSKKVHINPNVIVIDTKQSKSEFVNKVATETKLPASEIYKIMKNLKMNILEKSYCNILVEYYEENQNNPNRRTHIKNTVLSMDTFKMSDNPTLQDYYSELEYKSGSFKMCFHISAFKKVSTYIKDQDQILKDILVDVLSYDDIKNKKFVLLNETKTKPVIIDIENIIKEKKKKRNEIWDRTRNHHRYQGKLGELRDIELQRKYVKKNDNHIREIVGLHRHLKLTNLLRSENITVEVDQETSSHTSKTNVMKELLKQKHFWIKKDVGLLNKELHEKLLKELNE